MKVLVVFLLCLGLMWAQSKNEREFVSYNTPRSGILSQIVGGIFKPVELILNHGDRSNGKNNFIEGTFKEVLEEPIFTVADTIDSQLKAISPGTDWCGAGDRAKSSDLLGLFKYTDDCCRHHDNCPDNIPAHGSKHGLNNTSFYTRSHCDCDDEFYDCLKRVNSLVSFKIGNLYFNLLSPQCYKLEYPIIRCEEETGSWGIVEYLNQIIMKKCEKYEIDKSRPQEWQWLKAKRF